jgi:uncharacterized protein (TIGR02246 family)
MRKVFFLVLVSFATMFIPVVYAEEQSPVKPQQDADVRELLTTLADDFCRADMKSAASFWTADADFLAADGTRIRGREAIDKAFSEMMAAGPKRTVKFHLVEVRRVSKDVALVDAIVQTTPPRSPDHVPSVTLTLVKENGKWLIASAHETIDVVPAPAAHLQELAWLVGQWEGEKSASAVGVMTSTCDWTANHTFLIRKFTSSRKDGRSLAGTEVIGWDPRNGRIRSWVFDSTGGFGENIWLRDGKRWIIQHAGTTADGGHAAATYVATPVDGRTFTVQTRDRTVNAEREPGGPVITIKRVAATKPAAEKPDVKPGLPAVPPQ